MALSGACSVDTPTLRSEVWKGVEVWVRAYPHHHLLLGGGGGGGGAGGEIEVGVPRRASAPNWPVSAEKSPIAVQAL